MLKAEGKSGRSESLENIFIFFGTRQSRSSTIWGMFQPGIYQGRFLGEVEIAQIREMIAGQPQWHRNRISKELAGLWE